MRSILAAALIVPGVLMLAARNDAGQKEETQALLERAIKAMGADKAAKYKAHFWKAKGTVEVGGNKLPYTAEYTFLEPDKLRFVMGMEFNGKQIEIIAAGDGKQGWEQAAGQLRDMEKAKLAEFQHMTYTMSLTQLTPLKNKAYVLTSLGETKVDGKAALGIKVVRKGKRDVSLWFDKDTALLVRSDTRAFDEFTKKEVDQEVYLTGYRDKDGVKIFDKLTIKRDGKPFVIEEFSEQKMMDKVELKIFAKPEK